MSQRNSRRVIAVYGLSGSGKTRYASALARRAGRAIIVDGGFSGESDFPGHRANTFWEFHEFMKRNRSKMFRVRFCPTVEEFALVCDWARVAGDLTLIIDEADRFLIQSRIPEEFLDLAARSRHYGVYEGVSLVVLGQNPMQIPIDVRRMSTEMIIFNTAEPADVDWLRKQIGDEWAARCPTLAPEWYLEWKKGVGCSLKKLNETGA